jgi:hypothetical protein
MEDYRQLDVKKNWCPNFEKLGCAVGKAHLFESSLLTDEHALFNAIESECKISIEFEAIQEFYNDIRFYDSNGLDKGNFPSLFITLLSGYSYEQLKFANTEARAISRISLYRQGFTKALGTGTFSSKSKEFTDLVQNYQQLFTASFFPSFVPYTTAVTLQENNVTFANCSEAVLFNLFLNLAFVPGELDGYKKAHLFANPEFRAIVEQSNPLENFYSSCDYTAMFQNKEFVVYKNLKLPNFITRFSQHFFDGVMIVNPHFYNFLYSEEFDLKGIKGKSITIYPLTNQKIKVFCILPMQNSFLYELETIDINFIMLSYYMGLSNAAFDGISNAECLFRLIYHNQSNAKFLFTQRLFGAFTENYPLNCRYYFDWGQVILTKKHASMIYYDFIPSNLLPTSLMNVAELLSMTNNFFTNDPVINLFLQIQNLHKISPVYNSYALSLGVTFESFYTFMYPDDSFIIPELFITIRANPNVWTRKNNETNLFSTAYTKFINSTKDLNSFLSFAANFSECQTAFITGLLNHLMEHGANSKKIKIFLGTIESKLAIAAMIQSIPQLTVEGLNGVLLALGPILNNHPVDSSKFLFECLHFCNATELKSNLLICEKVFDFFVKNSTPATLSKVLMDTIMLINSQCTTQHVQEPCSTISAVLIWLICKFAKNQIQLINYLINPAFYAFDRLPFQSLDLAALLSDSIIAETKNINLSDYHRPQSNQEKLLYLIADLWISKQQQQQQLPLN